jgi:hypothetical protein
MGCSEQKCSGGFGGRQVGVCRPCRVAVAATGEFPVSFCSLLESECEAPCRRSRSRADIRYATRNPLDAHGANSRGIASLFEASTSKSLSSLENPLVALGSEHTKIRAHVRLSQGWHLLNEARLALIEAEACKVFYEECEPNPVEAVYRSRFYLDDAALRLASSCEHLLWCVTFYWGLGLPKKSKSRIFLGPVIAKAEKSSLPQVSGDVATSLRGLATDSDWAQCKQYRNDWVHNERPGIDGLDWEVLWNVQDKDIPPAIVQALKELGYPATASGQSASVGTGRKIGELHRVVRNAYCQLFCVYERLAPLLG